MNLINKKLAVSLLFTTMMCLSACGKNGNVPEVPEGYKDCNMNEVRAAFNIKESYPYTSFDYTVKLGNDTKSARAMINGEWPDDIPLDRGAIIISDSTYFDDWGDCKIYKNEAKGSFWLNTGDMIIQELNCFFCTNYYYLKIMGLETIISITWNR